jgi:hypothetical protein
MASGGGIRLNCFRAGCGAVVEWFKEFKRAGPSFLRASRTPVLRQGKPALRFAKALRVNSEGIHEKRGENVARACPERIREGQPAWR